MKRSTARWTTAIAATALLALPVPGRAQTPQTTSPASQQSSDSPTSTTEQHSLAQEHLRKAEAALNDIPAASLTGTMRTRVEELKRHINKIEEATGSEAAGEQAKATPDASPVWSSDAAAVDRILTALLEDETAVSGEATSGIPGAVGTSGTSRASDETAGSMRLDESARTKFEKVRTHMTAFTAAMGAAKATASESSTSRSETSGDVPADRSTTSSSPPSAESATAATSPTDPTPTPTGTSPTDTAQTPAPEQTAATRSTSSPASQDQPAVSPEQPASSSQSSQNVDTEAVKRHLTAARDSLSEMTQLPAAGALTGEPRAQVAQMISNFNELITTNTEWRASYNKVKSNLETLLSTPPAEQAAAPGAAGAGQPGAPGEPGAAQAGTPGQPGAAVGTSGTTELDPEIRAKLVEFQKHLTEFEKAASGSSSNSDRPSSGSAQSYSPSSSSSSAASGRETATRASETDPTTASGSTTTGAMGSTTGSSGTPAAAAPSSASSAAGSQERGESQDSQRPTHPSTSAPATSQSGPAKNREALQHIEAIEAILTSRSGGTAAGAGSATGTSGASSTATGTTGAGTTATSARSGETLDSAQIQQIKTHLSELRRVLNSDDSK